MPSEKSSGVAAVLSFFISGLGQIYNGQILKGIIILLIQAVNGLLTFILIGYIFLPIVWLFAVIDAYRSAEKINRRNFRRYNR
jgi:TM2 domain-containing membrane protein YozV